ncbi:hypothetical protein HOLleu_14411 [Holothuria leucospilota]|uniref:Reverse transcriptase domain-containing protein n=1 Tax=Holothuria leucospilota TaxID=206669 RepID=A0A9Q1HBR0_HOLLE|nr:hypothetical protein HOLleu_14411 [Holothuria leucospilota]
MYLESTNHDEVLCTILNLKNSSPGPDEIPPKFVKTVGHLICDPLVHVFNLSFEPGVVPVALKIARVIPVFKKGNIYSVSKYELLYDFQFGFLPGLSTVHALLHFTDLLTDAFEKKLYVSGTFLDLSKAFDCLLHNIL